MTRRPDSPNPEDVLLFSALLAEVLRLAWTPTPQDLAARNPAPRIAVVDFRTAAERADDKAWAPLRAADLLGMHLERLGTVVRHRPFALNVPNLASAQLDAVVRGRVTPADVQRDLDKLTLEVEVDLGKGPPKKVRMSGIARDFDALVAKAAVFVAKEVGATGLDDAEKQLAAVAHVTAVHRFLGQAELRHERGAHRQAAVMFDRARTFRREVYVPEAIEGRLRAHGALVALGQAKLTDRASLAASAAERAEVDGQRGRYREAESGWTAFLRYTRRRARRYAIEIPFDEKPVIVGKKSAWVVQDRRGGERIVFDPRTGTVLERGPSIRGLVGATAEHFLTLRAGRMARVDPQKRRPQWDVKLPIRLPARAGAAQIEQTSGLIGVKGEDAVVWLEESFGKVGQLALEVVPLASSAGGVTVLAKPRGGEAQLEIALLRPGKRTPAWRTPIDEVGEVAMTRDVVVMTSGKGLVILRTYNGKPVKKPLPLPPNARILGASGRYGCAAGDDPAVSIFDIIGGEKTAVVNGPSKALACQTTADGVAILFETGDLMFYDRDGKLLDRAQVGGKPIDLLAGHPEAPGPIAVTTQGLFAFGEIPIDRSRLRDVDGMVALARVLLATGDEASALAVATQVAMVSAGGVKEAEALRADILGKRDDEASKRAAKWARARARAAADPTQPLPRFRIGAP